MFRLVMDSYITTGSVSLEVSLMGMNKVQQYHPCFNYLFAGDDCVKNDFVEDVRIPTTYGLALLTNVRQRMEHSKCSSYSITSKSVES